MATSLFRSRGGWGNVLAVSLLITLSLSTAYAQENKTAPQLKTASTHAMQYYVALPEGWTSQKRWPVVVVIESANRQFLQTITTFVQARKQAPFILVAPLVVTNGGSRYREAPTYHYADAVWNRIESEGPFKFDSDGLAAVIKDVHTLYSGEEKYFLTGWEAGGHTLWALLFTHPETVRAAALVCPNYAGRWFEEAHISPAPERTALSIRGFQGADDTFASPGHPLFTQWEDAKSMAQKHRYRNVTLERVVGKGHEPLAAEVLAYFATLLKS